MNETWFSPRGLDLSHCLAFLPTYCQGGPGECQKNDHERADEGSKVEEGGLFYSREGEAWSLGAGSKVGP